MRIQNFEDMIAWQKGKALYLALAHEFANSRNYSFKDQLLRAALSITNNIAEGFDRGSDKELKQFLVIARGSCAEVRSMLHVAVEEKTIGQEKYNELTLLSVEISKILTKFIGTLATSDSRLATKE